MASGVVCYGLVFFKNGQKSQKKKLIVILIIFIIDLNV